MTDYSKGDYVEAFMVLAQDSSHDTLTHPNTPILQRFIKEHVIVPGTSDVQISSFIGFANDVVSHCLEEPCLCDSFQAVMQLIPQETPEQKRIGHALRKVAIEVGAYKPAW